MTRLLVGNAAGQARAALRDVDAHGGTYQIGHFGLAPLAMDSYGKLPTVTAPHRQPGTPRQRDNAAHGSVEGGLVIGAGLLVGSGVVINEAGPGAFLSYAITGVVIILVMRMLGETATANPSTGSFADCARKAWAVGPDSRWAGCTGTSG